MILNTPHNPSGHVASQSELELVAGLCQKHDAIAIADDVYETVVFDGGKHLRLADVEGMRDRTLTIGSAGKVYNLTGWRLGWAIGPDDLVSGVRAIHGYTTFAAATPLQEGIAAALNGEPDSFYDGVAAQFAANYELLAAALTAMGSVVCRAEGGAVGGYFLVADVAASGMDAFEYVKWLATEKKVAAVPLSVFYTPRPEGSDWRCTLVRFAICKERATIEAAVANLKA